MKRAMGRVALAVYGIAVLAVLVMGSEAKLEEAVGYITEAREVHMNWIEVLLGCQSDCAEMAERVGSLRHHKEWVRRYDVVLEVLGE